jgi:hypothetical protein
MNIFTQVNFKINLDYEKDYNLFDPHQYNKQRSLINDEQVTEELLKVPVKVSTDVFTTSTIIERKDTEGFFTLQTCDKTSSLNLINKDIPTTQSEKENIITPGDKEEDEDLEVDLNDEDQN